MIIDRWLSFNFTHLDIERSRGFGIVTSNAKLVQEAVKLYEADTTRKPYTPSLDTFVVSPVSARQLLADFINHAKRALLIYDPDDLRCGNDPHSQRENEVGGADQSHRSRRQEKPRSGTSESRQAALAHTHDHP